jgi:WD40 repeat protein
VHSVLELNFSGQTTEAISPDGNFLAAAGKDHVVKVWRLLWKEKPFRPVEEASLRDHRDTVLDLNFSADSRTLISSSRDRTVRLWDRVSTGDGTSWSERTCFRPGRDDIMDVALSPDGKILAMARHDEPVVILWDVPRSRPGVILRGHTAWVVALAFSRDSKLFATGGLDHSARLWDLTARNESEMLLATFVGHTNAVASLAFSPDGKILASGSDDSTVKIWDLYTLEERGTLEGHLGAVDGVIFSPDSRTLFTTGGKTGSDGGGEVRIWRAATDEEVAARLGE